MRVKVIGEGEVAKALRGHLAAHSSVAVVSTLQDFTLRVVELPALSVPTVDGVDGPLEAQVVAALSRECSELVVRHNGKGRDNDLTVMLPARELQAPRYERALFRALTHRLQRGRWWRRSLFALAMLAPANGYAQGPVVNLKCHDGDTSFWCSDETNTAVRVMLVSPTTVPVSGTVAATQSGTWNITNVSGTVSLPTGAATAANQATGNASLSVLDDWDESNRAAVNPISGQAGVAGGSGTVGATTQRVVVATDQPAFPPVLQATGTIDALNEAVTIAVAGYKGAGFYYSLTSFTGTIVAEVSTDGGTNWKSTIVHYPNGVTGTAFRFTSLTFADSGAFTSLNGATHYRLRISAYTGGSAAVTLSAAQASSFVIAKPAWRQTYSCTFILSSRPWGLSHTYGAAGAKQFATIHHTASSAARLTVLEVAAYVQSSSAAATYLFELRQILAAGLPVTGNPAITPAVHSPVEAAAAESTCLALPTTGASLSGRYHAVEVPLGVTAAGGTLNPPAMPQPVVLYRQAKDFDEAGMTWPAGTAGGLAVNVDASAAATLVLGAVVIKFMEE